MDPIPPMEIESSGDKENGSDFLKSAQSALSFIIGLVGLLTASGFIIVNTYLSQFSHIHGYSLNTGQYLAASIGALIFTSIALLIIIMLVVSISYLNLRKTPAKRLSLTKMLGDIYNSIRDAWRDPQSIITALLFIMTYSLIYGQIVYGYVPHYLGGGEPVSIDVIFKDADQISAFGFTTLSGHPNVASGIEMLAELSDGLLVYDPQQQYAAVIRDDEIEGVLDAESLTGSSRLLSAAETPTAEATPIQTAAP